MTIGLTLYELGCLLVNLILRFDGGLIGMSLVVSLRYEINEFLLSRGWVYLAITRGDENFYSSKMYICSWSGTDEVACPCADI